MQFDPDLLLIWPTPFQWSCEPSALSRAIEGARVISPSPASAGVAWMEKGAIAATQHAPVIMVGFIINP
ncbi:hypothetical protein AO073_21020 [Pseudomonas syringae ICMP 11293]|nr:hypothetical protein AO073_21020 [Pseudomonas syringae ICMP 11293]